MSLTLLKQFSQELEALVARTSPAVVGVLNGEGQGTGTVLAPDGYVLTNAHVVRGVKDPRIRLASGEVLKGELVGQDERTDLAVVRIPVSGLSALPLADSRRLNVGQLVVAIGDPFRFERSVSLGVISALDRSLPGRRGGLEGLIQTDAAINPGNSGGPLVDADGSVVGINTAIIPYAQGIGFSIPAHTAAWVAAVLMRSGEVDRPLLGIAARGEALEPELARATGRPRAVRVLGVSPTTPADLAGLREGDLLVAANGDALTSVDDLQRVMVLSRLAEVELEVWRERRHQRMRVRPKAMKAMA
jgi:S1-C subfamily serine protease